MLALLLALPAAVGLEVAEATHLEPAVKQRVVELLCQLVSEHTGEPPDPRCGEPVTGDRVEVRLFAGPTRVFVSAQRMAAGAELTTTGELPLDSPERWRAILERALSPLLPARAAAPPPHAVVAPALAEPDGGAPLPWILLGTSVAASAAGLVFHVLGESAEDTLTSRSYTALEHQGLVAAVDRDRALAATLLTTAGLTLIAGVITASLE